MLIFTLPVFLQCPGAGVAPSTSHVHRPTHRERGISNVPQKIATYLISGLYAVG